MLSKPPLNLKIDRRFIEQLAADVGRMAVPGSSRAPADGSHTRLNEASGLRAVRLYADPVHALSRDPRDNPGDRARRARASEIQAGPCRARFSSTARPGRPGLASSSACRPSRRRACEPCAGAAQGRGRQEGGARRRRRRRALPAGRGRARDRRDRRRAGRQGAAHSRRLDRPSRRGGLDLWLSRTRAAARPTPSRARRRVANPGCYATGDRAAAPAGRRRARSRATGRSRSTPSPAIRAAARHDRRL